MSDVAHTGRHGANDLQIWTSPREIKLFFNQFNCTFKHYHLDLPKHFVSKVNIKGGKDLAPSNSVGRASEARSRDSGFETRAGHLMLDSHSALQARSEGVCAGVNQTTRGVVTLTSPVKVKYRVQNEVCKNIEDLYLHKHLQNTIFNILDVHASSFYRPTVSLKGILELK